MLAIEYATQKLGEGLTVMPLCNAWALPHAQGISYQYRHPCFGAFDEQYGCCGSLYCLPEDPAFSTNVKVIGGVLEEECAELLDDFFSKKRLI